MDHPDKLPRITVDGVAYLHVPDSLVRRMYTDEHNKSKHPCELCPNSDHNTSYDKNPTGVKQSCRTFRESHGVMTSCLGSRGDDLTFVPFTTYIAWRLTGATT